MDMKIISESEILKLFIDDKRFNQTKKVEPKNADLLVY